MTNYDRITSSPNIQMGTKSIDIVVYIEPFQDGSLHVSGIVRGHFNKVLLFCKYYKTTLLNFTTYRWFQYKVRA